MISPFANLFLAMQERLNAIVNAETTADTRVIYTIDHDYNQFEAENPPVSWPAALIDIEDAIFSNLSNGAQLIEATVLVRLGFNPWSNTALNVPTEFKEKGLKYYDIEQAVYLCFHEWEPTTATIKTLEGTIIVDDEEEYDDNEVVFQYGALTRIKAETDRERISRFRVREQRFAITIQDYSALRILTMTPATLKIEDVVLPE